MTHTATSSFARRLVRNSWGTFWGTLGFFKLQRGVNALQIEAGDCWYAVPTWQDEQDVRSGAKVGTMWGIMSPEEAAKIKPEPHRRPHTDGSDGSDDPNDFHAAEPGSLRVQPWGKGLSHDS